MLWFSRRKYPASEVAIELAKLALQVTDAGRQQITNITQSVGVHVRAVEAEYRGLRVYLVETAVQTISAECDTGAAFLVAFHDAIQEQSRAGGIAEDFWAEQGLRTARYDSAWQDPRGVGTDIAVCSALAFAIGVGYDFSEVLPVWSECMWLSIELIKYLRSIRIVA